MLDMPWNKVRVIVTNVGGGYGGRVFMSAVYVCAAFLSRRTGHPIKIVNDREQEFSLDQLARHETVVKLKTGVKKGGTLMARDTTVIYDCGAYKVTLLGPQPQAYPAAMHVPFHIPNMKARGLAVYTNNQPIGPYKGYGHYQATWAVDFQLDLIARELGIDPMEIRVKNAVKPDSITPLSWPIGTCGLDECFAEVGKTLDWKGAGGSLPPGRGKGVGT